MGQENGNDEGGWIMKCGGELDDIELWIKIWKKVDGLMNEKGRVDNAFLYGTGPLVRDRKYDTVQCQSE